MGLFGENETQFWLWENPPSSRKSGAAWLSAKVGVEFRFDIGAGSRMRQRRSRADDEFPIQHLASNMVRKLGELAVQLFERGLGAECGLHASSLPHPPNRHHRTAGCPYFTRFPPISLLKIHATTSPISKPLEIKL